MAIRFDGFDEWINKTTNLPSITSFTWMAWIKFSVDRNTNSTFFKFGTNEPGYIAYLIQAGADGTTLASYNGITGVTGTNITVGQWYHSAMVVSGTGAGQCLCYLNGVLDITNAGNAALPAQAMTVGDWDVTGGFEPFNGCVAAIKVYDAALSVEEIQTEMRYYLPVRTANLNTLIFARDVAEAATDYSGVGGNWTSNGSLATEDGPPIAWMPEGPTIFLPAAAPVALAGDEGAMWYQLVCAK